MKYKLQAKEKQGTEFFEILKLPRGDQFDRIIAATAIVHRVPLITEDVNTLDAGVVPVIR